MANKNSPFGARPNSTLASASYNDKANKFIIPSTDSNNYFIGDFVRTNNTSIDGIPVVVKSAPGEVMRGMILSLEQDLERTQVPYRQGGVEQIVYVCEDPLAEFEIQYSGTLASTDIGKFADIIVGAGDTYSAFSTTQIDATTVSTTNAQLKILRLVERVDNTLGEFSKVIATIHQHELNGVGSGGSSDHAALSNLSYDTANHGTGKTGFQRGTTSSAIDPTVSDDDTEGYVLGDWWMNTVSKDQFYCTDNTTGAAVWNQNEENQVSVPSGPTDSGSPGQWAYGTGYMYRCVASNTWVRWVAVTSW